MSFLRGNMILVAKFGGIQPNINKPPVATMDCQIYSNSTKTMVEICNIQEISLRIMVISRMILIFVLFWLTPALTTLLIFLFHDSK